MTGQVDNCQNVNGFKSIGLLLTHEMLEQVEQLSR